VILPYTICMKQIQMTTGIIHLQELQIINNLSRFCLQL
jgi:hypothetical protein